MLGLTSEQITAIDQFFTREPPATPAKVKDWHTKLLIKLYTAFFGANPTFDEYALLCQVRDGKITLDNKNFWSVWQPAYYKLQKRYAATRNRREEMRRRANSIGGGNDETIYRDCCADEATEAQNSGQLAQHKDSFDKYKWIFVDLSHVPIQSKNPEYRLTITVKSGTITMLREMAIQHIGRVDSCVITRCYSVLKAKNVTPDETVPDEIGSFAIHEDVLDIFASAFVVKIEKQAKKK